MKKLSLLVIIFLLTITCFPQFPVISRGDVNPGDRRLARYMDESIQGEITIVSFNIRNLGDRKRSFKDYLELIDLVNEADIVVFQEVGLGLFDGEDVEEMNIPQFKAIVAQLRIAFGDGWALCIPPQPSGVGNGREINLVAYREICNDFICQVFWNGYEDLGLRRDLALFDVNLNTNNQTHTFHLGSVHLKPDDPYRGQEIIELANWFIQNNTNLIVVGDFNWGYRRTSGVNNYLGEERITALHDSGSVFQVFRDLSYLGSAGDDELRTNMGFRNNGYFYDQILLSPDLSDNLADGGEFLEDCGIFAFDLRSGFMKKTADYLNGERNKALKTYLDLLERVGEVSNDDVLSITRQKTLYDAKDYSTYFVSDHRIIWVKLAF